MATKAEHALTSNSHESESYKLVLDTTERFVIGKAPATIEVDITETLRPVLDKYGLDTHCLDDILGIRVDGFADLNGEQEAHWWLASIVTQRVLFNLKDEVDDLLDIAIVNKAQRDALKRQLDEKFDSASCSSARRYRHAS